MSSTIAGLALAAGTFLVTLIISAVYAIGGHWNVVAFVATFGVLVSIIFASAGVLLDT